VGGKKKGLNKPDNFLLDFTVPLTISVVYKACLTCWFYWRRTYADFMCC